MITRIVKMHFHSSSIEDFKNLFNERKAKILANDGCHSVSLLQDVEDPCIFFTYSTWTSIDHLNAYRHSPFFADTWQKTKAMMNAKAKAWSTKVIDHA